MIKSNRYLLKEKCIGFEQDYFLCFEWLEKWENWVNFGKLHPDCQLNL